MKRFLSFLTAALLLFCAPAVHAAGSYFLLDGFYYGVEGGEAYIHGCEGSESDMVIRERFLRYDVTSIDNYAFYGNDTIETLSFYDATALRRLGDGAFAKCSKLRYTNITPSIQEMGEGVFDGCTALAYVRFRAGTLTDIPAESFYGCTALSTVIFENEPTRIGRLAFAGCTALERIELPASLTDIDDTAFLGCDNLVIYCSKDSYAMRWAIEHGIDYELTDAEWVLLGDVNGDGDITVVDATFIQRRLLNMELPSFSESAADADLGGDVDIRDATLIQRYAIDLPTAYPIGTFLWV